MQFRFQHKAVVQDVVAEFYPEEGEPDEKIPITLTRTTGTKTEYGDVTNTYKVILRGYVNGDHVPGKYGCGYIGVKTAGGQHLSVNAEDLPAVTLEVLPEPGEDIKLGRVGLFAAPPPKDADTT